MTPPLAIIGMACEYPDARSPGELWENVLAQRRAFRRMPTERLRTEDYVSTDPADADRSYVAQAALIADYHFDRAAFRVAGSAYRGADLAHWLALDVAARALDDAGFPGGDGLPREQVGVFLGNTLTGEFSRANTLRLRWPYVRRVVQAALARESWPPERIPEFLANLEPQYKSPFPPVDEETLAGGLSNTIAGRICNHFDLKGGGYTLDGACASSLLAIAHACSALATGDLDVALAGGVDLSLDPFEIVGFAKVGALAPEAMRVYDARSAGFWPGEGCGVVVLMRLDEALAQHRRIDAVVRGWGVSSDGRGGITRPEVQGQLLALRRAYRRAERPIDAATYFEGHGTGTSVGDATELRCLTLARREAAPDAPPAALGSIKANIGHTKAAAGVAGLIKATLALRSQVLPPTTGCDEPHPELTGDHPALRVLDTSEPWPTDRPLCAGVSAMGFGGINAHVVLEGHAATRIGTLTPRDRKLAASVQDAELFLLSGSDRDKLRNLVDHLLSFAARLSQAELADLATRLAQEPIDARDARASVVASRPAELAGRLGILRSWLTDDEITARFDPRGGVFLGLGNSTPPRIGLLFPGQGSPAPRDGRAWGRRFPEVRALYDRFDLPRQGDGADTVVAQPAIVTASLAAWRLLEQLGISAEIAVGHSLGELAAYGWAGALDADALIRVATARGAAISKLAQSGGAMAGVAAGSAEIAALINGEAVVIAGLNAPRQTVISGPEGELEAVLARARSRGLMAARLQVSHAFHSPMVASAVPALAEALAREKLHALGRTVVSTVTGSRLDRDEDLRALLSRQVTAPVRFLEAFIEASAGISLWIEAGPGRVLSSLAAQLTDQPIVALDACGPSLVGLLSAVGAAYAMGATVNLDGLFAGRFTRRIHLDWNPHFFENPCERAPVSRTEAVSAPAPRIPVVDRGRPSGASALEIVRGLVAERTELSPSAVTDESRLLDDLHLNSIAVGQLVVESARKLGVPPPTEVTDLADATVAEIAHSLERIGQLTATGTAVPSESSVPAGVDSWTRTFTVELVEQARKAIPAPDGAGSYRIVAPADHPLAAPLRTAFERSGVGAGIVICLPSDPDERHVGLLMDGARAFLESREPGRFVLVQHGGGGSAFARCLHQEAPEATVCVVDVPADDLRAVEWVLGEARAASGFTEVHYDASGSRRELVLRPYALEDGPAPLPFGPADVVLVTGGGKGITAECALALARETGVRLALVGRSAPGEDSALSSNLDRLKSAGVSLRYFTADVTELEAVREAVRAAEAELGPITAILHGAGVNVPRRIESLSESDFLATIRTKVAGACNVLAAVDAGRLKHFVAFGSILARVGLHGEAHYAVANEWLARLVERFQREHPACRCLTVEWSVWSDVGMGQRLGRVESLTRQGITPIPPDRGVAILRRLLSQPSAPSSVIVTGRLGDSATLPLEGPALPALRFLERPRVYYPGVELVADADLSSLSDPYLDDHVFQGERLLPAVLGLEAMAQAANVLVGTSDPPIFENVHFDRPIVVSDREAQTIRVAALATGPQRVDVVLRCSGTDYQVDHFRATCCFTSRNQVADPKGNGNVPDGDLIRLDPARDLYDGILFQGERFRRLRGYHRLRSRTCLAEISGDGDAGTAWFGPSLPVTLVLGDPGARDATIQSIQACLPHVPLLPVGVDRIVVDASGGSGPRFVSARERWSQDDLHVFDLEVTRPDGSSCERWENLRVRAVKGLGYPRRWVEPLLGPFLERHVQQVIPGSDLAVVVQRDTTPERRMRSDQAIRSALGTAALIVREPDGRPTVLGAADKVSASHAGDLTMAVAGPGLLGCDVEPVTCRPAAVWADMLGTVRYELARRLVAESGENLDTTATRLWAAAECLKKAGIAPGSPMTLASTGMGRWVAFAAGGLTVATFLGEIRNEDHPLVLAIAATASSRFYEYKHVVSFEETNLLGNVYYTNLLSWQGRCRELFLRDHAPSVLDELARDLRLVTLHCSCDYLAEMFAFDEVAVRLRKKYLRDSQVALAFEYWRCTEAGETLVARGEQRIGIMKRLGSRIVPADVPEALRVALQPFE